MRLISDIELKRAQRENVFNKWGQMGQANKDKKLAVRRLEADIFEAQTTPKFQLSKQDRFFMIGSCFARGLEEIMRVKGLVVDSYSEDFLKWRTSREGLIPLGATNRYNTASIANDFRWHLDQTADFPVDSYLKVSDSLYTDPHMNPSLAPAEPEELDERRAIWGQVFSRLNRVNCVILTLGLTESWFDVQTNTVLNITPDGRMLKRYPGRIKPVNLGHADNLANLETIHALLKEVCPADFRVVVTVSPVPLMRTFTDQDIVAANQYSKSCLRAAAQEFANSHSNVDYFPSYEIAMNSKPDIVWEKSDRRHVDGHFSLEIMKQFFDAYLPDSSFEKKGLRGLFKRLF